MDKGKIEIWIDGACEPVNPGGHGEELDADGPRSAIAPRSRKR